MLGPKRRRKELPRWVERLHPVGFVLAILASLLLPMPAFKVFGPLAGIGVAVACFFVYRSMRFRYGGIIGSPLWLEMVDMVVLMASLANVSISIFHGMRHLFWRTG